MLRSKKKHHKNEMSHSINGSFEEIISNKNLLSPVNNGQMVKMQTIKAALCITAYAF